MWLTEGGKNKKMVRLGALPISGLDAQPVAIAVPVGSETNAGN